MGLLKFTLLSPPPLSNHLLLPKYNVYWLRTLEFQLCFARLVPRFPGYNTQYHTKSYCVWWPKDYIEESNAVSIFDRCSKVFSSFFVLLLFFLLLLLLLKFFSPSTYYYINSNNNKKKNCIVEWYDCFVFMSSNKEFITKRECNKAYSSQKGLIVNSNFFRLSICF